MFYEENEIGELVICPYCKNKYDDPRIVSCGNSFCMPCIEFLAKEESNGFKCPDCDEFHETPNNGFSKNWICLVYIFKLIRMEGYLFNRFNDHATQKFFLDNFVFSNKKNSYFSFNIVNLFYANFRYAFFLSL